MPSPEGSGWVVGKYSSPKEWCCGGAAARGGVGVTIPGGVMKKIVVALSGMVLMVGLDDH